MKKITILVLLFAFLGVNISLAGGAVTASKKGNVQAEKTYVVKKDVKVFTKIKTKVSEKVHRISNKISKKLDNVSGGMHTALLLMVVGILIAVVGIILGLGFMYTIGAVFFVIGAILLLLELL